MCTDEIFVCKNFHAVRVRYIQEYISTRIHFSSFDSSSWHKTLECTCLWELT